jgi:DNA (cytosine-5)-methyltransferase 1
MTSPPCQAFSLAGKRLGKDDKRGILFFNSLEFIQVNKPRYFIFENVKGLLSDDGGKTFSEWVNLLGGKSINGNAVLFPYEDSVPYHLYWQVLNAKHHGVPQNRERVFLIGIRDDKDNNFRFPVEEHLTKRLKDVLENEVDQKYYLSERAINGIMNTNFQTRANTIQEKDYVDCIMACDYKSPKSIKVKNNTLKGYEEANEGDSINFSVPSSETRRGRVGKGVAQTLDTACNQGVWIADYRADEGLRIRKDKISPCMTSSMRDNKEWNPKSGTRNPPLVGYDYKIRRLTPRECFRLMDFPDTFTWTVSDSQAYKQAGNSIVVNVLYKIIKNLNLCHT